MLPGVLLLSAISRSNKPTMYTICFYAKNNSYYLFILLKFHYNLSFFMNNIASKKGSNNLYFLISMY